MNKIKFLALALGLLIAIPSFANNLCDEQFPQAQRPKVLNEKLTAKTRELCFSGFVLLHSGVAREPLYSSEHLTKNRVDVASQLKRIDSFHEESSLPNDERAGLKDYVRSGFDRGHMSPNKDMSDTDMQGESFSLANMVPQNPNNNRNLHEGIEEVTRSMARQYSEIYVSTGPAFIGGNLQRTGNVLIPTNIWKAIYIPSAGAASAYWEKNEEGMDYEIISMEELTKRIGIDVFPFLNQKVKSTVVSLPKPTPHKSR